MWRSLEATHLRVEWTRVRRPVPGTYAVSCCFEYLAHSGTAGAESFQAGIGEGPLGVLGAPQQLNHSHSDAYHRITTKRLTFSFHSLEAHPSILSRTTISLYEDHFDGSGCRHDVSDWSKIVGHIRSLT